MYIKFFKIIIYKIDDCKLLMKQYTDVDFLNFFCMY